MGRALRTRLRRAQEPLALGAAAIVLCGAALLPFLALGAGGFEGVSVPWAAFGRTLATSSATTALALLVGVPLGLLLGRFDVAARRAALGLQAFPLLLPPFLLVLGWFRLFGAQGLAGSEATSAALFSVAGVVVVHALAFTPVVTSLTAIALQGLDASLEESALVVAKPRAVALRILLPIAWPAWALGALVVFALSFSDLGVPMFLRQRAYTAAVFSRLGGVAFAPGEAFALSLPLLAVALALLACERRLIGRRSIALLGLRPAHAPLPLGRWRTVASLACWVCVLGPLAPLGALAWRAAAGGGFATLPEGLAESIANALVPAAAAATLLVAVGLVVAWSLVQQKLGARLLDGLALLAFVVPGVVLGVGVLAVWNRPSLQAVYGSLAILSVGYVARYAILPVRVLASAFAQMPAHYAEAASASGASYFRRLTGIVLPVHARAAAAAWLLAAVFCLRDLETVLVFHPPGGAPLLVRILGLEANGREPVVAALAVVHVLVVALLLASVAALPRRERA